MKLPAVENEPLNWTMEEPNARCPFNVAMQNIIQSSDKDGYVHVRFGKTRTITPGRIEKTAVESEEQDLSKEPVFRILARNRFQQMDVINDEIELEGGNLAASNPTASEISELIGKEVLLKVWVSRHPNFLDPSGEFAYCFVNRLYIELK